VLCYCGAPWTLAAYAIEGKSSKDYINIKRMAFSNRPCCITLGKLADAIALYVRYQIAGAQVVQMFDSWQASSVPRLRDICRLTSGGSGTS